MCFFFLEKLYLYNNVKKNDFMPSFKNDTKAKSTVPK